jgi:hypothetical protein
MDLGILFMQKWERDLKALRAARAPGQRRRKTESGARLLRAEDGREAGEKACCPPRKATWQSAERV